MSKGYGHPITPKKKVAPVAPPGARGPVAAPTRPAPKKPSVSPDDRAYDRGTTAKTKPLERIEPLPKPSPLLQQYGYHGSVNDFVQRIHEVTRAHEEAFGYKPAPGFAFDLARFHSPFSPLELLSGGKAPTPEQDDRETEKALLAAANQGDYHDYLEKNPAAQDLVKRKPGLAVRALSVATAKQVSNVAGQALPEDTSDVERLRAMGMLGNGRVFGVAKPVSAEIWKGVSQVADSLVHAPGGTYQGLRAVESDTGEALGVTPGSHGKRNVSFKRTRAIGKGMAKQTVEDVRHPLRNPGYLFLDILGLASAGGGTAARLGAAGKALRAGEGAGTIGKALVRRPNPGTFEIGAPGAKENVLLSENSTVRAAQRVILGKRQKAFEKRQTQPAGVGSVLIPQAARDFMQKHFSFETKIGREARARLRYEDHLSLSLKRELDAAGGASINQSRVWGRAPKALRKGLTRGEQKAIQVMSWDDPNPLQAERAFHQQAIDAGIGDAKAHQRQLADLKLAEKVLQNPRPQFLKALELTRQVIAEQQRIKIEQLGLDPTTAEKRVIASGEVLRGEPLREGVRQNPESFYLPQVPKGKAKRAPYSRQIAPRIGPGGVPPPRDIPELKHVYEGHAIQVGNIRIDATALAGEAYARTVRAATLKNEYDRLWASGKAKPETRWDRPIRSTKDIPDDLRIALSKMEEGMFTAKDAAGLSDKDISLIHESLAPGVFNPKTDRWELEEPIKNVRWVDERTMAAVDKPPAPSMRVPELINEPFRDITLYLRPAYILNLLGNVGMALLNDSAHFVPNMSKAVFSHKFYDAETVRTMEALVGEGKAKSYITGQGPKLGRVMGSAWSRITDRDVRVSQLLREFHRKGWSDEQIPKILKDKSMQREVIEAARRANKSMVEFDNLTWVEQNYFRHFIFVYPWVSRSGVWSLRTIMEHPIKTNVLSHLGRMNEEDMDSYFKNAPEWFKRTGYFPVGWDKNNKPKLVNPTSVNSFSTMAELLTTAESGTTDVPYASTEDLLGPFATFMLHGASGRDDFGNEYPGGDWTGAAKDVILNLPQIQMEQRRKAKGEKKPAFDITDRGSLAKRERAGLEATVFSPGWLQGYGGFLAGGLSPRLYDPDASAARFWAGRPYKERHQHEMALIDKALKLQGEYMKRPVPKEVKYAVDFAGRRELVYKQWQDENGNSPSTMQRTKLDLTLLEQEGRIKDEDAAKIRKALKDRPDDVKTIRSRMLEDYAGANDMHQWDEDVRWVASFKPEVVADDMQVLKNAGLPSRAVPQNPESLKELGLKTLAYRHEVQRLQDQEHGDYDLQIFEQEHDKPIRVNGIEYPSPVRLVWARKTAMQRAQDVAAAVTKSWHSMSQFERELVGKKTKPMAEQWRYFDQSIKFYRQQYNLEGHNLPSGYKVQLAKYINKMPGGEGFLQDFYFDQKPMYERLPLMRPIQKSPHHSDWVGLITLARDYARAYPKKDYSATSTKANWKLYVDQTLKPELEKPENKGFRREVELYGKNFLYGLIN